MKKTLIISLLFCLLLAVTSLAQGNKSGARIKFIKTEYNFGSVKQNNPAECRFVFQNTGNEPLVLASVGTTCGCTVPEWSKKPVMPGKYGIVKVSYNTSHKGSFRKVVSVKSNAANQSPYILRISGKVE